jgi:hypothetical protein
MKGKKDEGISLMRTVVLEVRSPMSDWMSD